MTLARMLGASVARDPDAIAIVEGDLRLTYARWEDEVRRVAGGLLGLGLTEGEHLVAVLSNRYEMATLFWSCQMLGVVFTPFNWRASAADVTFVLEDAEAKLVVYEDRSAEAVLAALKENLVDAVVCLDDGEGMPYRTLGEAMPYDGVLPEDDQATCLMLYTSGTTGRPKGVPRSHAAERIASIGCIAQLHYGYGEVSLGVMPLFHTMGIRALAMSVYLNGAFVCMPTFDTAEALSLIGQEQISCLFLVPTMFHDMVHHPDFERFDPTPVRNLAYAGMSMTTALVEACTAGFEPDWFSNFYGSSEIYTFAVSDRAQEKPGCAGRPGMGQQIRIVRADLDERVGPDAVVARGETGEIIARMDSLDAFSGYWKRPDADEKAIREGWYFTGDLGRFDEDGELYVVGRVDDMLISGGENIYPEEVEDLLAKCALVHGVAVIGLPDERWGQRVVAFIEPASQEANADALDKYCLDSSLARFKRPRGYAFVAAIPRSASGKLLRRELRLGAYELLDEFEHTL